MRPDNTPKVVDYSYAFATPHRLTLCEPVGSDKTILDVSADKIRMAWSYDNLKRFPLATFACPMVNWDLNLSFQQAGAVLPFTGWRRVEGYIPALQSEHKSALAHLKLNMVGGASAVVAKIELHNTSSQAQTFSFLCTSPQFVASGYNPAAVDEFEDSDTLLAGWKDRADRILVLCLGAQSYGMPNPAAVEMTWTLAPGASASGWLIRPYEAYRDELPTLRCVNWSEKYEIALQAWRSLIARAAKIDLPDEGVKNAMNACLADLFVMREPVAEGYVGGTAGTEIYRATNNAEPAIQAICLDQMGYHTEALEGYRLCFAQQGDDGDWADPKGWSQHWWSSSGFKSWFIREHYHLTNDKKFLEEIYPRMLASSQFQESRRASTRKEQGSERPVTYGLMPRGQGDCGLFDGDSYYGVYYPHNFWATFADGVSVEAAKILGKPEQKELEDIYQKAHTAILKSLERGAIEEDGYRWIPAAPCKTSGSRWGALNALTPCRLLPADHPLIDGTVRKMEQRISPGGQPLHTGWMQDGMWVAITLDNLAQTLILRGDGDSVVRYIYSTLNHGTPLTTWCEERGQQPGSEQCAGDRQHLFTPIAVIRILRDSYVLEDQQGLHLARAWSRSWLATGQSVGVEKLPTHYGPISYHLQYDQASKRLRGSITCPNRAGLQWIELHLRLPEGVQAVELAKSTAGCLDAAKETIRYENPAGEISIDVKLTGSPKE